MNNEETQDPYKLNIGKVLENDNEEIGEFDKEVEDFLRKAEEITEHIDTRIHLEDEISKKQKRDKKLPETVSKFKKVCCTYSRYNDVPATIGYYSILGDLVKHMVEIPFGPTTIDTRVHLLNIQTARSGKTTLIKYVLLPLMEEIYKDLGDIEDNDGKKLVAGKVCKLTDYTTASLIGSHTENQNYTDDEDELNRIYEDDNNTTNNKYVNNIITEIERDNEREQHRLKRERNKEPWLIHFGPIHGEGFWFADEFENSGVFKERQHKEGMTVVFQHIMNNFHIGANVYEKILTGKPIIALDSKFTILAATFIPEKLRHTVTTKGVIQRFLPYIWDVPDDTLTDMRKKVISKFGIISEQKGPPLFLKKDIIEIFNLTKTKYESVGKDRLKTVSYTKSSNEALDLAHTKILDYIKELDPYFRKIIRLFEMNLIEYIAKLAVLNCITESNREPNPDKRFIVSEINVKQGEKVVKQCYEALVEWLEKSFKQSRTAVEQKNNMAQFKLALANSKNIAKPHEKIEGGYVWKKLFIKEAEKILKQSNVTIYKKYDAISNEYFEEQKSGKNNYVRLKEENEE